MAAVANMRFAVSSPNRRTSEKSFFLNNVLRASAILLMSLFACLAFISAIVALVDRITISGIIAAIIQAIYFNTVPIEPNIPRIISRSIPPVFNI